MATSRGPHGSRARRELIGGWVAAVIAVLAVVGLFQVSDPGSGYEYLIWYLAPAMFLASASAAWFGLRARRDGEEGGRWPALVGFAMGVDSSC
jgi:hypothetical protein